MNPSHPVADDPSPQIPDEPARPSESLRVRSGLRSGKGEPVFTFELNDLTLVRF